MHPTLRRALAAVFFLALLAVPAYAQMTAGDITGRVVDEQGNAVPGATATARNDGTGLSRTAITDAAGEYTIRQLPPGRYTITFELTGFRKAVLKDHEVTVGTRETMNVTLKLGEIAETVEVTAEAALIETTKSEIGGVVTPLEIENLPRIDRTFAGLSTIMPEARPVGNFDPTKTHVGNFAMNGGDGRQLDVNVDGGDNKDNVVGSLLQNFAYESIQEFQVLQHRWTAEQGRAVGGVINVVSKSGTNDFHGSAFTNFRDKSLRAKDFFEKQSEGEKADFRRWEFGGSLGGPIVKDKLFFFGALERFKENTNTLVDPKALPELELIPGAQPVSQIPTDYKDTLFTIKVDHHISNDQTMFYRYAQQRNSSPNDQVDNPASTDLSGGNTNDNKLYDFVVGHTFTTSSSTLNQFSFHFQDFTNEILAVTDRPNIVFPSVQTGANVNVPQQTKERKYQLRDDFTWNLSNHAMKFGVNYIYTKLTGFFFFGAKGYTITFFDDPSTITSDKTLYPEGFATPGAVQRIELADGNGDTSQPPLHQLALYYQDDWRVNRKLTLNLGVRWDANIKLLPDQTNNRTIKLLQQLDDPVARGIAGDPARLSKTTPSWTDFQPRLGFAYDPKGDGRTVIRGGYGIFFDQIFQNLTLFSTQQTNPTIYQTLLSLNNSAVGEGQLANFRFGDPLPGPSGTVTGTELEPGAFGRINDPDMRDPYVQKFSIGFQKSLGKNFVLSSDYVHTLGLHEARVWNINPRIATVCDPLYPGSNPSDPRCVSGATTRYFDAAFVKAGLGAGRLTQSNMIGTTNRSLFDSWTTQLRGRWGKSVVSLSYVLASSRAWGGQPVASYSGNGIAVTSDNQFKPEEFGPTRIDERHRIVASGVFDLPGGFQLAPIVQFASARPYSLNTGFDIDGDGRSTIDRICASADPAAVFAARGNSAALRELNPRGCQQVKVNSQRGGFFVDANGNVTERSGRFFNVDLRLTKTFKLGDRAKFRPYVDFYNLFNTENVYFSTRTGLSNATSKSDFEQAVSLYGPGFGPPVGRPLTVQFGGRFEF